VQLAEAAVLYETTLLDLENDVDRKEKENRKVAASRAKYEAEWQKRLKEVSLSLFLALFLSFLLSLSLDRSLARFLSLPPALPPFLPPSLSLSPRARERAPRSLPSLARAYNTLTLSPSLRLIAFLCAVAGVGEGGRVT